MGAAENRRKEAVQYLLDAKSNVNQGSWVRAAVLLIPFVEPFGSGVSLVHSKSPDVNILTESITPWWSPSLLFLCVFRA